MDIEQKCEFCCSEKLVLSFQSNSIVYCVMHVLFTSHEIRNQHFLLPCRKNGTWLPIYFYHGLFAYMWEKCESRYEPYHSQCMRHRFFSTIQSDHVSDRGWCKRKNNRIMSGFRRFIIHTSLSLISLFPYLG